MNDLIHKIVGTNIEVGQSDVGKFRLGETIRYTPSEILEILKQHENEIFGEEKITSDLISRQAAIRWVKTECNPYGKPTIDFESGKKVIKHLETMPSVQTHSEGLYIDGRNDGYREGWKDGRTALRREIWEDERDRLD